MASNTGVLWDMTYTPYLKLILKEFLKALKSFGKKFCWKSLECLLLDTGGTSQWRGFNFIPEVQEIHSADCIDT